MAINGIPLSLNELSLVLFIVIYIYTKYINNKLNLFISKSFTEFLKENFSFGDTSENG